MKILDTDHISLLQVCDAPAAFVLQAHLAALPPEEVVTTIITVEEQMRGWLERVHRVPDITQQVVYYERLRDLVAFFAEWEVLPFDAAAAATFVHLRQQGIRIGTMDLKIAAIALTQQAVVLSGNLRDFQRVPALRVEDWRAPEPPR